MIPSADPEPQGEGAFDILHALRFVFDDPGWVRKIVFGSLATVLSLCLIGIIWIAGYSVRLVRRTADRESHPLPEWDDLGGMFLDGVRATAVLLIHAVPFVLIMIIVALALGGAFAIFETAREVPSGVRVTLVLVAAVGYAFFALVSLALFFYIPSALARFVLLDRVGAAFELRENISFIRRNLSTYSQALSAALIAGFVAQFGVLVLCVGIFPATFWSTCVLGFAVGKMASADRHLKEEAGA